MVFLNVRTNSSLTSTIPRTCVHSGTSSASKLSNPHLPLSFPKKIHLSLILVFSKNHFYSFIAHFTLYLLRANPRRIFSIPIFHSQTLIIFASSSSSHIHHVFGMSFSIFFTSFIFAYQRLFERMVMVPKVVAENNEVEYDEY